jgi:hypothetical protein
VIVGDHHGDGLPLGHGGRVLQDDGA